MATDHRSFNLGTADAAQLAQAQADIVSNASAIATKASKRLVVNEQTGAAYSLVQGDEDLGVSGNRATAQTFTAPQLAAGTVIPIFQTGAGQITVAAGSGVTLRSPDGAKTAAQYKSIVLRWHSVTEVWISGQATT